LLTGLPAVLAMAAAWGSLACSGTPGSAPGLGGGAATGGGAGTLQPGGGGGSSGGSPGGAAGDPIGGGSTTVRPPSCTTAGMTATAAPPRTFFTTCSGCHSAFGPSPVPNIPDLFAFMGSAADFSAQVRAGGKTMPPFSADAIPDQDLALLYEYFKAGKPTDIAACTGTGGGPILVPTDSCTGATVEINPLFAAASADGKPVVSVDASGVIHTRGAGRVRGRHELETEFSPYHALYFENRSFEFRVEDTIAAGGSTVKVSYLPVAPGAANPITNFRAWKIYGNGNVFHANEFMQVITNKHYEFTVKNNARESRPMRKGDILEFEFGVFSDPGSITGRTNYYTDTYRYQVGVGGLSAANNDPAMGADLMGPELGGMSAGAMTFPYIKEEPVFYFSQMGLAIQPENVQPFLQGRRLFHTDFTTGAHSESGNPALTEHAGKAGPIVNQTACVGCHAHNGRGQPPAAGTAMSSMVVKLSAPGTESDANGGPLPHPSYGKQLQNRGASGTAGGEGEATIAFAEITRQWKDGTSYTLLQPTVGFRNLAAGAITGSSVRVARQLVGMGMLEAISEPSIVARADVADCNKDGISGRPNMVFDPESGKMRLGRFGWKASKASVTHQVAEALLLDMNVTTRLFPAHECLPGQAAAASCTPSAAAGPELSDENLGRLVAYMRDLGVPPRRNMKNADVQRGEVIFTQSGCVSCHAPTQLTGANHPFVELRNQLIRPYTDLLLHDMGPDLADSGGKEYVAEPSEWRTPPLWGIGAVQMVSGHSRFLHDGRARTLLEAVLWHGGEAEAAKQKVLALTAADRAALQTFLQSL
jgi:CxxC motif-containing protein (DUF1111 family)